MASQPNEQEAASLAGLVDPNEVRRQAATTAAAVFDRLLSTVEDDLRPRWSAGLPARPVADGELVWFEGCAGTVAEVRVWLHNVGPGELNGVAVAVTELCGPRAARIERSAMSTRPRLVDVAAGGSAAVTLLLAVPLEAVPGVYAGRLVCDDPPAEVGVRLVLVG